MCVAAVHGGISRAGAARVGDAGVALAALAPPPLGYGAAFSEEMLVGRRVEDSEEV